MMPAGEELDAAVAKTTGDDRTYGIFPDRLRYGAFSTDVRYIPAMLAWLTRSQEVVTVQVDDRDAMAFWRMLNGTGDTIQHALANLVVQVAEHKDPTP